MLLPRSSSSAATKRRRPQLARPGELALLSGTVLLALVLFFPRQELLLALLRGQSARDPVSLSYLQALAAADPDNRAIRKKLAENLLGIGDYHAARREIRLLEPDADASEALALIRLDYRALQALLWRQDAGSAAFNALRKRTVFRLGQLIASEMESAALEQLAREAGQLGATPLALRCWQRLAQLDRSRASDWWQRAARASLAVGDAHAASDSFVRARRASRLPAERQRLLIAAINALEGGGDARAALLLVERELDSGDTDRDLLIRLIKLARAANRLDAAERYARLLLQLALLGRPVADSGWRTVAFTPDQALGQLSLPKVIRFDAESYLLGYEVLLGNGKLDDALAVAASAVRQQPADRSWRRRLAQIAEWAGQPTLALEQWRWLGERDADADAWLAVQRLAPGLRDDDAAAAAWRFLAGQRPLRSEEWRQLVDVYERIGEPQQAMQLLQQRLPGEGQRGGAVDAVRVELLAGLAVRTGNTSAAHQYYRRWLQWQPNAAAARQWAELLIEEGKVDAAWALLKKHPDPASAAYWASYGELAWQLNERTQAEHAYRQLLQRQPEHGVARQRLIELLRQQQPEAASELAATGWRLHRAPLYLLIYQALAADQLGWAQDDAVLATLSAAERQQFELMPGWWYFQARRHAALGDTEAALAAWQSALRLAPGESHYRLGLLWALIDAGQGDALRPWLQRWASDAALQADYWEAYAAGWQLAGEPAVALRYNRRLYPRKRRDANWLAGFADQLAANGFEEQAYPLWRQAWRELQRRPVERGDLALRLRLAGLLQQQDAAQALRRSLLLDPAPPPGSGDGLVADWIAQGEDGQAARWLQTGQPAAIDPAWPLPAASGAPLQLRRSDRLQARAPLQRADGGWAQLALYNQDNELLAAQRAKLTGADRVQAAIRLDGPRQAAQLAMQAHDKMPFDRALWPAITAPMLAASPQAGWRGETRSSDELRLGSDQLLAALPLGEQWQLGVNVQQQRRTLRQGLAATLPPLSPATPLTAPLAASVAGWRQNLTQQYQLQLGWQAPRWRWQGGWRRLAAGQGEVDGGRLAVLHELSASLQLDGESSWREAGSGSDWLALATLQQRRQLGVEWAATPADRLRLAWEGSRQDDAERQELARQRYWRGEWRHRWQGGDDEWLLQWNSEYGSSQPGSDYATWAAAWRELAERNPQFSAARDAALNGAQPAPAYSHWLHLGYGLSGRDDYSRRWRPFASLGAGWHSNDGALADWRLGGRGSVFGGDQLALEGSGDARGGWRFSLGYDWWF